MKVVLEKPQRRELTNLRKSAKDIFAIFGDIEDEQSFFEALHTGCVSKNAELIRNKVADINSNTDHNIRWLDIYNTLMEKYEFYLYQHFSIDTLMDLIKYHSLEEEGHVYLGGMNFIDEDNMIYYEYNIDGEYANCHFEDIVFMEAYMEAEISVEEAKRKYVKYHIRDNLGMFRTWYFSGCIGQYVHLKKTSLPNFQVLRALTLTIDKVYEKLETKDSIEILEMIKKKISSKKYDRNQQIESFQKLSKNAFVDYVSKDTNNDYFFPLIANMLYHGISTKNIVHEHKDLAKIIKDLKYEESRFDYDLLRSDGKESKLIAYLLLINEKPVWHYVMSVYSEVYGSAYKDMWKLVKFLIYKNQNNHSHYHTAMKVLPSEIVEINLFTDEVI